VSATTASMPMPVALRRRSILPVLLIAGALLAASVLSFIGSNVWASLQQNTLERRFETAAASWAKLDPLDRSQVSVDVGDPIARLEIPTIGLQAVVVEGATPAIMRRAPGHLPGSATPGDSGVAIVTANRVAFGGFFLRLDRVAVGDRILTESPLGRTTYVVTEVRVVEASALDLGTDSARRILMLFGSSRLIGGSDRLVVTAVAEGNRAS
jgi:sortase A